MMQSYDIAVVGGGMVGLAFACGLKESNLRIVVIETNSETEILAPLKEIPEVRVSAISPASEQLLRFIGAWGKLPEERLSRYNTMQIWEKDSAAKINFGAEDYHLSRLGYIIENHLLRQTLWQTAQDCPTIDLYSGVKIDKINFGENEAFLNMSDGNAMSAKLIVGADGANSFVRQQADIPISFRGYGHSALVAVIETEEPHKQCAYQSFHGEGILAFLPLVDEHLCSIVWSLPPERAAEMQNSEETEFLQQLELAIEARLGRCQLKSSRNVHPLIARYAKNFVSHRVALVGDAAHTIHPLAGLGANMGFADAAILLEQVQELQQKGRDIGSLHSLRHYNRNRKYQAMQMLIAMRGLKDLFSGVHPLKKIVRDTGLTLVEHLPIVKSLLVKHAVGLKQLPSFMKK